jgi:hypothetical protein
MTVRHKLADYSDFPLGPPMAGSISDPNCRGYVYVIGSAGSPFVKIGSAACPGIRMTELQCGNPNVLELMAAVGIYNLRPVLVEMATHRLVKDNNIRGEWFSLTKNQAITAVIKAARNLKAKFGPHVAAFNAAESDYREGRAKDEAERRRIMCRKLGVD